MLSVLELVVVCSIVTLCLMLGTEIADRSVSKTTFVTMWVLLIVLVLGSLIVRYV